MIPPRVEHASGKRRPFPAERNARRNGRQPRQDDHDCDALVREHDNKAQHHQEQQLTDGRRDCSARRRYRQGEKHQKQLQAQQHGQARISDPDPASYEAILARCRRQKRAPCSFLFACHRRRSRGYFSVSD